MTSSSLVRVSVAALTLTGLGPAVVLYAQPPFPASEAAPLFEASVELRIAFERLPLAAAVRHRPRVPSAPPQPGQPQRGGDPDAVSAPVTLRTRDVSDTFRLVGGNEVICRWEEKRPGRG
jgi:hypothetical protein